MFHKFSAALENQLQTIPDERDRMEYLKRLLADTERNMAQYRDDDTAGGGAATPSDSDRESDRSSEISYAAWKNEVLGQQPPPQLSRQQLYLLQHGQIQSHLRDFSNLDFIAF